MTGHRAMAAVFIGAALLVGAPLAGAEPPPQQCAPDDQQCQQQQQQQQGMDIANQVIDGAQQGLQQAEQAGQPPNPGNVDIASSKCQVIDGVPVIIPPEGLTLHGNHVHGGPCWYVYGVEPHN